ncbi:MAG TPA: AI-2E family transporter [Steroidobacteraceae bacterium]|nr:AI-2E family transporter [Steroidobacteraceae bacterium]
MTGAPASEEVAPAVPATPRNPERGSLILVEPPQRPRAAVDAGAGSDRTLSRAVWIIAICALALTLRVGHDALIPLGLAALVACVLSGVVESLRRRGVPRALSAAVLLALLSTAIAGTIELVATPAQQWLQGAPQVLRTIEHKVRPAQSLLRRLDYLTRRAAALGSPGTETAPAPPAGGGSSLTAIEVFAATGWAAVSMVTVLAFAFLLLAAGPAALARMACGRDTRCRAMRTREIIDAVRRQVGRYYGTLLLINLCFAAVTAGVLWLLGMPSPALWGVLAGLLNFVPYVGPALAVTIFVLVGLVTFEGVAHTLLVAATYLALATVEGHVIEPIFLGRRLNVSPVAVLFALWIGGWLWGVAGVVLALPTLLALQVATRMTRARAPGIARQA